MGVIIRPITRNYTVQEVTQIGNEGRANFAFVTTLHGEDAHELSHLFCGVVGALPYYNQRAKTSEFSKYSAARLKEYACSDPDSVVFVKLETKIVGFCFSRVDDELIWLNWIGVHHDYRGQGLASSLLRALDERARRVGAHKVWCDCRANNRTSKLMLMQNGYTEICTIPNHWYGQDYILWQKLVG